MSRRNKPLLHLGLAACPDLSISPFAHNFSFNMSISHFFSNISTNQGLLIAYAPVCPQISVVFSHYFFHNKVFRYTNILEQNVQTISHAGGYIPFFPLSLCIHIPHTAICGHSNAKAVGMDFWTQWLKVKTGCVQIGTSG